MRGHTDQECVVQHETEVKRACKRHAAPYVTQFILTKIMLADNRNKHKITALVKRGTALKAGVC